MKIALTGGSSGIGAALAAKLLADSHEVTAFDLAEPPQATRWIKTDLADPASITQAIAQAQGPFDGLALNAGLPPREGQAELILRVNWFGLVAFLDGVLDKLAPNASIVSTASRAGAHWRENLGEVKALMATPPDALPDFIEAHNIDATRAYNLSKEAVIALTHARCAEMLARGFRINCVSPAAVSTGILSDFTRAFGPKVAANIARVGRPGTPGEVASVIAFLLSPASGWIKGQDITIDGGMSALNTAETLEL